VCWVTCLRGGEENRLSGQEHMREVGLGGQATRQDKTGQGKIRQDKTREDNIVLKYRLLHPTINDWIKYSVLQQTRRGKRSKDKTRTTRYDKENEEQREENDISKKANNIVAGKEERPKNRSHFDT
jgi:hypothetical protein